MQATGHPLVPIVKPLPWWRLPMAGALVVHGRLVQQCQLCGTYLCQPLPINQVKAGCYDHWFNRLQFICQPCHQTVEWGATYFNLAHLNESAAIAGVASVPYAYPFDVVMRQFKNSQQLTALLPLVHALRQLSPPTGCRPQNSLIVPVPTTTERIRERGFAPVWWLSLYLSFHWQIPLFFGISRAERRHQQGLDREQRLLNMQGAFELGEYPKAKHLIIFDDVVTTGATLSNMIQAFELIAGQTPMITKGYQYWAVSLLHGS